MIDAISSGCRPMNSTIHQSLSAFTRLSGNCGSSPLLTSSRRQRRSCDASSKPTTSPIEIFVIRKTGESATSMYFGRLANFAVKTCAFRSRPIGLRREMTNLPLAGGRELLSSAVISPARPLRCFRLRRRRADAPHLLRRGDPCRRGCDAEPQCGCSKANVVGDSNERGQIGKVASGPFMNSPQYRMQKICDFRSCPLSSCLMPNRGRRSCGSGRCLLRRPGMRQLKQRFRTRPKRSASCISTPPSSGCTSRRHRDDFLNLPLR